MLKWILFAFLFTNTFALEISLSGAKEDFQNYSTLHITDKKDFLCKEIKNDFKVTTQVICAFSKQSSKKLKKVKNDLFTITTQIKNRTFFLIITPHKKVKLYPMVFDLSKEDSVYNANVKLSKHWMLVGYNDKMPYIKEIVTNDSAIDFPFHLSAHKLPFVGGLDMQGNPVHIKKIRDVSDYITIKELFKEKKYTKCLELIDEIMIEYPNSLFTSEFIFYKIKVHSELEEYESVMELSKVFLREFSADENIPEVLSLVAKAYAINGIATDADYFFDRLFNEHEKSVFTQWGYIYKAGMLESSGASSKALEFYKKALHETQDIDVAATAAYKLAQYYLNTGNKKEAADYVDKILNAKSEFFMNTLLASEEMMYSFAEGEDYKSAAGIAKAILDETGKKYDEHEKLLRDRAIWLSKTDDKQEALDALNEYMQKYPEGLYERDVEIAKDSLFFDDSDQNLSTRLAHYDNLMDTYGDDTIGSRAIYEKAKLLLENEMFREVLDMQESMLSLDIDIYKDVDEIIEESAIGTMKDALKNKECQEVLNISNDYNITLSSEWDEGIYDCSMMGANFLLAKKITSSNLSSKDLKDRKKWLYRHIRVDFRTGNYSDVVEASSELITLIKDNLSKKENLEYKNVYRILFDTYQRLEDSDSMIKAITDIEKIYGVSYKDIERYVAVMGIGSQTKNDNLIIKYGSEVVNIQNSSKSYAQSPYVEFTLYQAYTNKDNYNKALEIIKSLNSVELDKNKRARQKYLLGTAYEKLWRNDEAIAAYQEAIDADPTSAWAKLAKDAKDI